MQGPPDISLPVSEDLQNIIKRLLWHLTSPCAGAPARKTVTMMGNKGAGGPFAPLVVVTRNIVGEKDFNKLRGKAISLHSQGRKVASSLSASGGAPYTSASAGPRRR